MLKSGIHIISLLCLISLLATGCSSTPQKSRSTHITRPDSHPVPATLSKKESSIYKKLNAHYQRWRGTPYEMGGMNRNGIDCSGFVYLAFRDALGVNMPRSTAELSRQGNLIRKNQLQVGDLVFFKTGRKVRHVGIYMGNQRFIHASTSSGVMKSNLSNPYWRSHYWKSTRVLSN